ncbi:5-hydroxytryptamine receptor 3A-like [Labrus mixtus]|uniref:5-hydroxytryptamine receptor 3A-like n=1 Tax=Labrus mixtus TaxID=508554 RepID=UPI0029C0D854|nr:5-hydroxytryptamine receptor 3A-like [Labrus mixtus]
MKLSGFLFLLLFTGGNTYVFVEPEEPFNPEGCNKTNWDVIQHLNLTRNKDKFAMTRPAKNGRTATEVTLALLLYAILDVQEKEQKFISYVWIDLLWKNDLIHWEPSEFCGIKTLFIPAQLLWQPDITIEERTERDKATDSPYIGVGYNGDILLRNDMVLVTTCKMQIYKFPFDIQSCNLSFKSIIHREEQIMLVEYGDQNSTTEWSQDIMRTQSDWLFINIQSTNKSAINFEIPQSMVVYTVNMKRRSILYVVNFILPVLLFLCLDLASFMISDSGGEKLSFKVTVLLAVTVMQLILNEILPSTSDRIPLIATYCTGIFGLMMLSLLETILVMYLMEKDSASQDNNADMNTFLHCDVSREMPSELLLMAKQASSSQLTEESQDFEKEVMKSLAMLLSSRKEEGKTGYWTRVTQIINKVFFISYVITVTLFLTYMYYSWNN